MPTVEQAFAFYTEEICFQSRKIFEKALEYKERGCFICYFDSIPQLMTATGMPMRFATINTINKKSNADLYKMIEQYNLNEQFVIHLFLKVSKKLEDGIFKSVMIHKNAFKLVEQLNDQDSNKASAWTEDHFDARKFFNQSFCVTCQIQGQNLQRCSQCKSVTYCSTDCQKADWKKHKERCKDFAKDRDVMIERVAKKQLVTV